MSKPQSQEDVLYLQRACSVCGLYQGPLDGTWSPAISKAEADLDAKVASIRAQYGLFDARSERNIATLIPPAQDAARRFMIAAKSSGLIVRIISGSRTYAEQDALFAIGRTSDLGRKHVTNAKGGESNHNFGIAGDVGIFTADGHYLTGATPVEEASYKTLGAYIKAHVPGIEWGGDWTSFVDRPHYQLATGYGVTEIRKRFEAGKSLLA